MKRGQRYVERRDDYEREQRRHRCRPGMGWRYLTPEELRLPFNRHRSPTTPVPNRIDVPAGTPWRCTCGTLWIAERLHPGHRQSAITWRMARRRERKRFESLLAAGETRPAPPTRVTSPPSSPTIAPAISPVAGS